MDYKHFLEDINEDVRIKEEPNLAANLSHSSNIPAENPTLSSFIKDEFLNSEDVYRPETSSSEDCDFKIHLEDLTKFEPNNEFFVNPSEITITPVDNSSKKKRKRSEENARQNVHYNADAFKCECGYMARSTYALNRHLITHQSDDEVIWHDCDKCSFKTKHKDSLRAHKKNIHTFNLDKTPVDGTYRCDDCEFTTRKQLSYRKHIEEHMDKSLFFSCDLCDFQTRRKKNLKAHALIHKTADETQMYQCPHCVFETKYRSSIHSHILTHFDPRPGLGRGKLKIDEKTRATFKFKCSQCDYRGKTRDVVKNHELTHVQDDSMKVLVCHFEGCSFKTARRNALTRHYLVHQKDEEVTWYQCNSCSFQTRHKGSLKNHLISHKTEAELTYFSCNYCSYNTKWKNCFKRHRLAHVKAGINENPDEYPEDKDQ